MASLSDPLKRLNKPDWGAWLVSIYRGIACVWLVLAVLLTLNVPDSKEQSHLPDPWAYRFAVKSFAQGQWVVTDEQVAAGRMAARLQGGHLTQYVNVGPDQWALEKAPGFPLLAVPLQWLGIPHLTNAALAVIAAIALYGTVAVWSGEGLACAAVALFLLTPMSLAAQHNRWMDTFASGAVPLIGGAFYFLYLLRPTNRAALVFAFIAGLGLGGAVVVRLSNMPLMALCGLHLLLTTWRTQPRRSRLFAVAAFTFGGALTLGGLALYNQAVFGRLFDAGYAYSIYRISFAVGGAVGKPDVPVPAVSFLSGLQVMGQNLVSVVQPWLIGFPMLALALPGWIVFERHGTRCSSRWLLTLWGLGVALPYISFTWLETLLTQPANRFEHFFEIDRYFFPWIFPLVILSSAVLGRLPRWAAWGLTALSIAGSLWFYIYLDTGVR